MTRTRTRVAVAAVVLSFVFRAIQLTDTVVNGSLAWWGFEVARWVLVIGAVVLLARAVEALQVRLGDQEERLRTIAAEAMIARLELDVVPLEDYADRV